MVVRLSDKKGKHQNKFRCFLPPAHCWRRGNRSIQPWPSLIQKVVHALLSTFWTVHKTRRHKRKEGKPSFQKHAMFKLYQSSNETDNPASQPTSHIELSSAALLSQLPLSSVYVVASLPLLPSLFVPIAAVAFPLLPSPPVPVVSAASPLFLFHPVEFSPLASVRATVFWVPSSADSASTGSVPVPVGILMLLFGFSMASSSNSINLLIRFSFQ